MRHGYWCDVSFPYHGIPSGIRYGYRLGGWAITVTLNCLSKSMYNNDCRIELSCILA